MRRGPRLVRGRLNWRVHGTVNCGTYGVYARYSVKTCELFARAIGARFAKASLHVAPPGVRGPPKPITF